nr:MAG TPA: hypothetical protein [Crassvirales sp.]
MLKINIFPMNKFKLILKGVLLWTTTITIILFILTIDIIPFSYIIVSLVAISILCYTCYKVISEDELETLTLCKYFGISIKEK